jgi:hypothetical protein
MPAKQARRRRAPSVEKPSGSSTRASLEFLERRGAWVAMALTLVASIRIAATYPVFSHTFDEPAHIACGLEYLDKGVYKLEPQHPPLARAAAALGAYLTGIRYPDHSDAPSPEFEMSSRGLAILYSGGHYDRTLMLARLAILPFFWIACWVVYRWAKRYFGPAAAAVAVFFFSFLPPVLAHAGLATTDMALTAFLGAAFLAALAWAENPTPRNAAWFGLAGGLAVLSKFSCLVFFPVCAGLALLWYIIEDRPGAGALARSAARAIPGLCLAGAIAFPLVWAGYRFSFGKVDFTSFRLPFPELYQGIEAVMQHDKEGHLSYLLGKISMSGFWYYYPVVLAVKTPLGFLALAVAGVALAVRRRAALRQARWPLAFAAGILAVGFFSRINIGVRHILPVYIGLSIVAAAGAVRLLGEPRTRRWLRYGVLLAALWLAASSLLSHPDYLAYFNELAGSAPEKILVDSDLDWGQDMKRLSWRLREIGASEVYLALFTNAAFEQEHGFPPSYQSLPDRPGPGWNAIGVSRWKLLRRGAGGNFNIPIWPDRARPVERVGRSILLYYFQPAPRR